MALRVALLAAAVVAPVIGGDCSGRYLLDGSGNITDGPGDYAEFVECEWTLRGILKIF